MEVGIWELCNDKQVSQFNIESESLSHIDRSQATLYVTPKILSTEYHRSHLESVRVWNELVGISPKNAGATDLCLILFGIRDRRWRCPPRFTGIGESPCVVLRVGCRETPPETTMTHAHHSFSSFFFSKLNFTTDE